MLTDPLAPTNAMAQCKGGCVPSEVQLGPCKPINPYKKKSGFSLTPHVRRDFWARRAGLYPQRERCPEKFSIVSMCDQFSQNGALWCSQRWPTQQACNTQGTTSSKAEKPPSKSKVWNRIHKSEIQPLRRHSYFTHRVSDSALNSFIFSKPNTMTVSIVEY